MVDGINYLFDFFYMMMIIYDNNLSPGKVFIMFQGPRNVAPSKGLTVAREGRGRWYRVPPPKKNATKI